MSFIKRTKNKSSNLGPAYEDLLQLLKASTETAQSYETLWTRVHLLNSTHPLKTLMITSTQPEEGKTTITASLGIAATLEGKKVVIVDADLRRPRIHEIFKLEKEPGFADVLNGTRGVEEIIRPIKITNDAAREKQTLGVVTSGRVSPTSFNTMASPKLKEAIRRLKDEYDTVLIDSPPVLSVSDALLLAPIVDGIILVLNTGVVTEADAKLATKRLEQAGGRVLGVVMNRFDEKLHGPGFHPYQSYYRPTESGSD